MHVRIKVMLRVFFWCFMALLVIGIIIPHVSFFFFRLKHPGIVKLYDTIIKVNVALYHWKVNSGGRYPGSLYDKIAGKSFIDILKGEGIINPYTGEKNPENFVHFITETLPQSSVPGHIYIYSNGKTTKVYGCRDDRRLVTWDGEKFRTLKNTE